MNRTSRANMNHRISNSSLQQAQSSWQDINRNSDYNLLNDYNLINSAFNQAPPQAHQHQQNQIHQPAAQVQNAPLTRAAKAHRYMTRQTLSSPITACNGKNVSDNNGLPQNVVLRPLAFYDEKFELIRTNWLRNSGIVDKSNDSIISFMLSIEQADMIAMSQGIVQVILRFCYFDESAPQNDNFPPDITILVNDKKVILPLAIQNPNRPNQPGKRPGQHVDITKLVKLSPHVENYVKVQWIVDPTDLTRQYGTSIIIGERQTADTLLQRIIQRGPIDPSDTKNRILDSDSEVATTNLQCSLICPLGKMRMINPCKAITCQHIPCFDASIYLQMNEKKATWNCPVCFQPAYYPDLRIDGYFKDVLQRAHPSVTDVSLNLDGTWEPVIKIELAPTSATSANKPVPEVIVISDDEDDEE